MSSSHLSSDIRYKYIFLPLIYSCVLYEHLYAHLITYLCINLELFPNMQSMRLHDLAKHVWLLFNEQKWK
jgi:hypothetical protein